MKNSKKLNGKDLINIGIFLAIDFVIVFAVAMTGFIPVMIPMLCVLCPLFGAIPFMLFLTKVKKFGMITIFGILMGFLNMITGMGVYPFIGGILFGFLADVIYSVVGKCESKKMAVFSSGIIFLILWANELVLFVDIEGYFATKSDFGTDYVNTLSKLCPTWMCPVLFVTAFVCGTIGALIGLTCCKKHFAKAGII
ncbi:MAG: MptD family putative ECF transporter S component [Treponema sp.]|nr:MptD family putative ECF transporter S component [Treponema sp.]